MHATQWIISIILATSLCAASAMAADATPTISDAPKKLEKIDGAPAAEHEMKDCPMNKDKKDYEHKKGELCPDHQDKKHHDKTHKKCDYKQPTR